MANYSFGSTLRLLNLTELIINVVIVLLLLRFTLFLQYLYRIYQQHDGNRVTLIPAHGISMLQYITKKSVLMTVLLHRHVQSIWEEKPELLSSQKEERGMMMMLNREEEVELWSILIFSPWRSPLRRKGMRSISKKRMMKRCSCYIFCNLCGFHIENSCKWSFDSSTLMRLCKFI